MKVFLISIKNVFSAQLSRGLTVQCAMTFRWLFIGNLVL
jgi:hypothetical protein